MNSDLVQAWPVALDACVARGGEVRPLVIEPPATAARVKQRATVRRHLQWWAVSF